MPARIAIGARTSIQDGVGDPHAPTSPPTVVGDDCVIGHLVHLEGCTIESGCLVGSGSVVLHRVIVRTGAIVAANSVVLNDTEVPAGALAVGSPVVIKPGRARPDEIPAGVDAYLAQDPNVSGRSFGGSTERARRARTRRHRAGARRPSSPPTRCGRSACSPSRSAIRAPAPRITLVELWTVAG